MFKRVGVGIGAIGAAFLSWNIISNNPFSLTVETLQALANSLPASSQNPTNITTTAKISPKSNPLIEAEKEAFTYLDDPTATLRKEETHKDKLSSNTLLNECFRQSALKTIPNLANDNFKEKDVILPNVSKNVTGLTFPIWQYQHLQEVTAHVTASNNNFTLSIEITGERTGINYISILDKTAQEKTIRIKPTLHSKMTFDFDKETIILEETSNPNSNLDASARQTNNNLYYEQMAQIEGTMNTLQSSISLCFSQ